MFLRSVWLTDWPSRSNVLSKLQISCRTPAGLSAVRVWLQVRATPAWGETVTAGCVRARGRVSAATNPIISFLRGLGKSNGWLEQSWGPVIHCTHFLCQYVPLTPSHSSLSWRHQPISSTLLGPDPERASDVSHTWTSGLDMFKHYRALI